jgi:hypothetical protein
MDRNEDHESWMQTHITDNKLSRFIISKPLMFPNGSDEKGKPRW